MKKNFKNIFKVIVLTMSAVMILSSCGTKTNEITKDLEDTKPVVKTTDGSTDSKTPTDEKTTNLIYWTIGSEPKDEVAVNDKINEYTKEKLNTTVDIRYIGWGDYATKMAQIIQSGEYYDIAFGGSINNYNTYASKNYFYNLKDLVPNITPDLYKSMPEELWKAMDLNGVLFGVPVYKDSAAAQFFIWNKEIVDKVGIDISKEKTIVGLTPTLEKIKGAYPNDYPIQIGKVDGLNAFDSHMDILLDLPRVGIRLDDGKAVAKLVVEEEETMSVLKEMHKWMKAGYINSDAGTVTEATQGAVGSAQGFPGADANWSQRFQFQVVSNLMREPVYSTKTVQGSFQVISASSNYPEQSLKYLELVNTDQYLRNLVAFGIEGVHFEKTGDTTIKLLNNEYEAPAYSQGTFFELYTIDPSPVDQWQLVKEQNETAFASPLLGFAFNTEPVKNQISATSTIYEKYKGDIITGTVDPEVQVPKLREELNRAGFQEILDELQKQIDEFLASK